LERIAKQVKRWSAVVVPAGLSVGVVQSVGLFGRAILLPSGDDNSVGASARGVPCGGEAALVLRNQVEELLG
jgi:hypothetical protein